MSPIFVMGLLVSILFSGLAIDIGRMELIKIQMQNAADAGALGAELESERGIPGGSTNTGSAWDWVAQGKQDAALNGFTDGVNGTTVAVVQNPTSGAYAGHYDAVQVTVTQTFGTIFMGALNGGSYTLIAQGVALVPACSYFLGSSSAPTPTFQNASATLNSACPVYVNNNYVVDGFARLWGYGVGVSGSASSSTPGGWMATQSQGPAGAGVPAYHLPTYGVPVRTDPLSSIAEPTTTSCTTVSYTVSGGSATLSPGTYCGSNAAPSTAGIAITNATVTLNPGLYYITGGMTCNNSTITGTGVTLFFTNRNGLNNYGTVNMGTSSPCTVNLSAPLSTVNGGIPGILFFASRGWISTGTMDFTFNTNSHFSGDGIWYLPNTGLYIWQNSFSVPHYGSLVVRNTYFFGTNINQAQDYSWLSGGSPFRTQGSLVQ